MIRAAVVLGAAVWPGGQPSPALKRRAAHALALWQAEKVDILVACGGLGDHPPTEAAVMTALWRAAGVPEAAIRCEGASTTTRENLTFALPILRAEGVGRVVIVTDRWHAPRARLIARQLGLAAVSDAPTWRVAGIGALAWQLAREGLGLVATLLRLR